jgi:hypothetical protein
LGQDDLSTEELEASELDALMMMHKTLDEDGDGVIAHGESDLVKDESLQREDDFRALSLDDLKGLWQNNKARMWTPVSLLP